MPSEKGIDVRPALATIQQHVGHCHEWLDYDRCGKPAEYVLWGKLIPTEGLGPRCYDCAVKHVSHHALASRSSHAIVNLTDLAYDVTRALEHWRPRQGITR